MQRESDESVDPNVDSEDLIKNLIYTVRGKQVMLDRDLARLYQVETKTLNRAAKRNEDRFPDDFRFRMAKEEVRELRCQIGTLADDDDVAVLGRTYLPYAYTEQGVAMLSAVLRSATAVQASVRIMRAFVEMRHFIANNALLFDRVRLVELRQLEYQKTTDERFERVFDYMEAHETPKQKVFFAGQVYDAFEFLVDLIEKAQREIVLVDNYVDIKTLNILSKKAENVSVRVMTRPDSRLTARDIDVFNEQYPTLKVGFIESFHDRFLVLDGEEGYLIGASLKDAGKKSFAVTQIADPEIVASILGRLAGGGERRVQA